MTAKKNTTTQYASNMQKSNGIILSPTKIISGVITTLIIGAVVGSVGIVRVSDSTALKSAINAIAIEEIKSNLVPRSEFVITTQRLDRIEAKIDRLLEK
jgi:hypothetical protein